MDKKLNEQYESPQVEVIEVEVEQGFASSYAISGVTLEDDMGNAGGGSYPGW